MGWDFPGGPVIKTSPSSIAGGAGSIPGWGTRIPPANAARPKKTTRGGNGAWPGRGPTVRREMVTEEGTVTAEEDGHGGWIVTAGKREMGNSH